MFPESERELEAVSAAMVPWLMMRSSGKVVAICPLEPWTVTFGPMVRTEAPASVPSPCARRVLESG